MNLNNEKELLVEICSKNRYQGLAILLSSVVCQTLLPNCIMIQDDNDEQHFIDIKQDETFRRIFAVLDTKKVKILIHKTEGVGVVRAHQDTLLRARNFGMKYIYRVDDDCILSDNVLENLYNIISQDDTIGAVGPSVLPLQYQEINDKFSNTIPDLIQNRPNIQWFMLKDKTTIENNQHLYSSFMYRITPELNYNMALSDKGFREETLFSYEINKTGKLIVDPSSIVYHLQMPGGVDKSNSAPFESDNSVFLIKLEMDKFLKDKKVILSQHGLGDEIVFSTFIPQLKEKYGDKLVVANAFPQLLKEYHVPWISKEEATIYFNGDFNQCSVYEFMAKRNYLGSIYEALAELLEVSVSETIKVPQNEFLHTKSDTVAVSLQSKEVRDKEGKIIPNAKDYPYRNELTKELKNMGYKVIQVGIEENERLEGVDEYWFHKTLDEVQELITNCRFWITVDNGIQHLASVLSKRTGIVLWSQSDPLIFGYDFNINLLKSRKNIRRDIHGQWQFCKADDSMHTELSRVIEIIKEKDPK